MIQAIETSYAGYRFRSRLEARWAVFFDTLGLSWQYEPEGFELYDGECDDCQAFNDSVMERVNAIEDGPERMRTFGHEIRRCTNKPVAYRYLPDFHIDAPSYKDGPGWWVEVKGSADMLARDAERIAWMVDYWSPIPGIRHSGDLKDRDSIGGGLILLGDIPDPRGEWGGPYMLTHHKGVCVGRAQFNPHAPTGAAVTSVERIDFDWGNASAPDFPDYSGEPSRSFAAILSGWAPTIRHKPVSDNQRRYAFLEARHKKVTDALAAARSARFEHGETPR